MRTFLTELRSIFFSDKFKLNEFKFFCLVLGLKFLVKLNLFELVFHLLALTVI